MRVLHFRFETARGFSARFLCDYGTRGIGVTDSGSLQRLKFGGLQTGLVAQVVGQLFDYKVGHGRFNCCMKRLIASKSLISMEIQQNIDHQVTDPGYILPESVTPIPRVP